MIGPAGFGVPHFGEPAQDSPIPGANVGDFVVLGEGGAMVVDGGFQALDPFALAVLQNSTFRGEGPTQLEGEPPQDYDESDYLASHWPDTALTPLNSPPCAQLDVAAGQVPRVWLAGSPTGTAESPAQGSEDAIPDDQRTVTLDRGHGAFVQVGTWDETESDSTVVIDPLGKAYPLVGGPITLEKLGYDLSTAPRRARRVGRTVRRGRRAVDERGAVPAGQPAGGAAVVDGLPAAAVVRLSLACAAAAGGLGHGLSGRLRRTTGWRRTARRSRPRTPPTTRPASRASRSRRWGSTTRWPG